MAPQTTHASELSIATYASDPMFPRIERVVAALLEKGNVVAPVDVLVGMGLLRPDHLEAWRLGQVIYLEKVIAVNLSRLSRLLRIQRFHAHDLNLEPSATVYMRGKGPRQRLRITKSGDRRLTAAYATHFRWPGKVSFHAPRSNEVGNGGTGGDCGDSRDGQPRQVSASRSITASAIPVNSGVCDTKNSRCVAAQAQHLALHCHEHALVLGSSGPSASSQNKRAVARGQCCPRGKARWLASGTR